MYTSESEPVLWPYPDTPITASQVRDLLAENERLRAEPRHARADAFREAAGKANDRACFIPREPFDAGRRAEAIEIRNILLQHAAFLEGG